MGRGASFKKENPKIPTHSQNHNFRSRTTKTLFFFQQYFTESNHIKFQQLKIYNIKQPSHTTTHNHEFEQQ